MELHSIVHDLTCLLIDRYIYPYPPKKTHRICTNYTGALGQSWGVRTPGPPAQRRHWIQYKNTHLYTAPCSKKGFHQTHGGNFVKSQPIFKILSSLEREGNFQ